jgi:hypothetical protein
MLPLLMLPLLAATPATQQPAFVPFAKPSTGSIGPLMVEPLEALDASRIQVDSFDPVARAQLLQQQLPRTWQGFLVREGVSPLPASLSIERLVALGAWLDLTGTLNLGGDSVPVEANINAKSDQLELLLLGDSLPAGLEPGGQFQGLQMLKLSIWEGPRLTSGSAVLQMAPGQAAAPAVRGLW